MICLSAFVGSQTKMFLCKKRGPGSIPLLCHFQSLRLGVQNGTKGWVCGMGAACQVWRRMRPEEVGVTLLMVES